MGLVVSSSRAGRVRTKTPIVVLVGGYAGCGKTELSRILARRTGWPMLDKDTITRPVVEAALELLGVSPHDRESDTYLNVVRPREYEALLAATSENVECGNSAIVTAPFLRELTDLAWIDRTRARYTALGADVHIVWVSCDPDTMHTYLRHRGAARDAAKLADWSAYLRAIDLEFRPPVPHVVVDNSASSPPLQSQADALIQSMVRHTAP